MPGENDFMNVSDAAALLGVHIQTLRKLARQKKIPAFKVGRDWRFHREAVLRWVEGQQLGVGPASVPNAEDEPDRSTDPQRSVERGPSIASSLEAVRLHMADRGHHGGTSRTDGEDRDLAARILNHVADPDNLRGLIRTATLCLQKWLGCDAVGIRLRKGLDFPYYETRGFSGEFVLAESSLCERDSMNQLVRDREGDPVLECMCGNIVSGRFDPSKSFYTDLGTFWTNSTTELLANTTEEDRQARTRNRCNGEGYESVALIPLKSANEIHGLLQINDKRKNLFDHETLARLERVAECIARAVQQRQVRGESANDALVGRWMADQNVLVITGRSVLPPEFNPTGLIGAMILEVALDSATHRVLTVACQGLPELGQEMLTRLLVGRSLSEAFQATAEQLTGRYYSELREPVIAALEEIRRGYRALSRQGTRVDMEGTCSVLIVDDDEGICRVMRRVVEGFGCSARTATSGAEGLERVVSEVPDLILLDLVMPEMNGAQFLEELREIHPDLPVVIVTGHPDPDGELMKAAARYAPIMLLAKPIVPALLERTVRTVMGDRMGDAERRMIPTEFDRDGEVEP